MPFSQARVRVPSPPRVRVAVFAVGGRAYTAGAGGRAGRVTVTDDKERPLASLSEGAEVMILAWRPGWNGTTRYSVRVMDSGLEGWLAVGDLRRTKAAIASPPAPPPSVPASRTAVRAPNSETSARRFGQRSS